MFDQVVIYKLVACHCWRLIGLKVEIRKTTTRTFTLIVSLGMYWT